MYLVIFRLNSFKNAINLILLLESNLVFVTNLVLPPEFILIRTYRFFCQTAVIKALAIPKTINFTPILREKVFAKSILLSFTNRFIQLYYPSITEWGTQSSICTLNPVSWYVINEPDWAGYPGCGIQEYPWKGSLDFSVFIYEALQLLSMKFLLSF